MHLPKRIELWALLAVLLVGLAWVFLSGGGDEEDIEPGSAGLAQEVGGPLQLHRCVIKRDYNNARLDIELRVRNETGDTLHMVSPKVKLLTGQNREVPSFFLPFEPAPELSPKTQQDVQLRYWLEKADLEGILTLQVNGNDLQVKGGSAFDLGTLNNGEEKVIPAGTW